MAKSENKISRRSFLGAVAGSAIAFGAAGYAAGYLTSPKKEEIVGKVEKITETKTVTAPLVDKPIKLGLIPPLTGYYARDGEDMVRGTEMAVEELNAQGGILGRKVEFTYIDVQNYEPEILDPALEKLITVEKCDVVGFGTYPGCVYPPPTGGGHEVIAKYDVPYINMDTFTGTQKMVLENHDKYWKTFMVDCPCHTYSIGLFRTLDWIAEEFPEAWVPTQSPHAAALIRGDDAYSQQISSTFREVLEKEGWKIVVDETVTPGTVEWGPLLEKIRAEPVDVIHQTDYIPRDLGTFVKQFAEKPTPALIYLQYGANIPEFLEIAGKYANGVLWAVSAGVRTGETFGQNWVNKYIAKYNEPPGYCIAPCTYSQIFLYKHVVELAGTTDVDDFHKTITNMLPYRGIEGAYNMKCSDHTCLQYFPRGAPMDYVNPPESTHDGSSGISLDYFQVQNKQHMQIYPPEFRMANFEKPEWLK